MVEELNKVVHWFGDQTGITFLQTHDVTQDRFLIFGLALVLMMLLRPGGLFPSAQRQAEMEPENADISTQENQQLYDLRAENEPALGERA